MKNVKIIVSVAAIGIAAYALWPAKRQTRWPLAQHWPRSLCPRPSRITHKSAKPPTTQIARPATGPMAQAQTARPRRLFTKSTSPTTTATKLFNAPQPSACSPTTGPSAICPRRGPDPWRCHHDRGIYPRSAARQRHQLIRGLNHLAAQSRQQINHIIRQIRLEFHEFVRNRMHKAQGRGM